MLELQLPIKVVCFFKFSVWYNPKGIVNVLSLKTITSQYEVAYNSNDRDGMFVVHIQGVRLSLNSIHGDCTTWTLTKNL